MLNVGLVITWSHSSEGCSVQDPVGHMANSQGEGRVVRVGRIVPWGKGDVEGICAIASVDIWETPSRLKIKE